MMLRILMIFLRAAVSLRAATNLISGDEIPPLRPPRDEIPPGFWEQYGVWVVIGGVLALVIACTVVWFLLRPKPPVMVPPAVEARQALEGVRHKPEDGLLLSRVSQILRHYFTATFLLPPGEATTTEFCVLIAHHKGIGSQLSASVSDFLRGCDLRKFSPSPPAAPPGAVEQALEFIDQGEARRALLEQWANQPAARPDQQLSRPVS